MTLMHQHGTPVFLPNHGVGNDAESMDRIHLAAGDYDERWLQEVLQENPSLLPIMEIEPAYRPVLPVCMELPTPRGSIDNFFLTPNGNLIFAEVKLWKNPQARREVIAQVIDYVESLTGWSYEELDDAAKRARKGIESSASLYALIRSESDMDEKEFVDAVSRNLRMGRGLYFIVGDGIREEAETLADRLQSHAGMHFALALIELACYRLPDGNGQIMHPRTIARTVNIDRGIVHVNDARTTVRAPELTHQVNAKTSRQTLSEEEFYERLAEHDPTLRRRLRAFLERLEPLNVRPEFRRSLIFRWHSVHGTTHNIGYVLTDGAVSTDMLATSNDHEPEILDLTTQYVKELAQAIGGEAKEVASETNPNFYVYRNGRMANLSDLLDHEDEWFHAIRRFSQKVNERLEERG